MKNENFTLFEFSDDSYKKFDNKIDLIINKKIFLEVLSNIETLHETSKIKLEVQKVLEIVKNIRKDELELLKISIDGDILKIKRNTLLEDLSQIVEAQTVERAKYYISRLKKSLIEIKTSKINDINLNRWKEYDDIITDSLWILENRDNSGAHNAGYWGNFIPQIPNQFLRRYTKQGENGC